MEDTLLLQAIERYLDGSMLADEKTYFEELRKNTPGIDQMVVEHQMFLQQMDEYAADRNIKSSLHQAHAKLTARGDIHEGGELSFKGRVVHMLNRYKRVTAIAASVGGVIALAISALMLYFSPVHNNQLQQLSRDVERIKNNLQVQGAQINEVKSKLPQNSRLVLSGSGFLIDAKGYIVTNAHVLKGSGAIVANSKGEEFYTKIAYIDAARDLAILKINDEDYTPLKSLPYSISKGDIELGDEVFTLGYPRNDITYNKGDVSARTGYNGDTTSWQIQMSANPGNSGGPVLNKNGEVIGILSNREVSAEGVTFAIKSKNIFRLVNEFKADSSVQKIKLPVVSNLKGQDRATQVKKMEDCVFLIKTYNNNK